jgi:hypothetical protein
LGPAIENGLGFAAGIPPSRINNLSLEVVTGAEAPIGTARPVRLRLAELSFLIQLAVVITGASDFISSRGLL